MFVNDGIFIQAVGTGQEYCWSHIFTANVFHNGIVLRLRFVQFWKELHLECTVKALKGQNSSFFRVVNFLVFVFYIRYFSKTTGKILNNVLRLICRSHAKMRETE